jgi:hypothetical protein
MSRDSAVGIAPRYFLDDRGVAVRVPVRQEFFLLHSVQAGSGVYPTSYPMGTGGFFPGGKAAGADNSLPTSAKVKQTWVYTFTPAYAFMA